MYQPNLYDQSDKRLYNIVNHKGELIRAGLTASESRGALKFATLYGIEIYITTNWGLDVTKQILNG